jgi:hypothetical protein
LRGAPFSEWSRQGAADADATIAGWLGVRAPIAAAASMTGLPDRKRPRDQGE